jgi:hypothetical protein
MPQDNDAGIPLELVAGTSLRYEGSGWFNGYWNGEVSWTNRLFLVLDGEYRGHRATHTQWTYPDTVRVPGSDVFPPAGLEATTHRLTAD